MSVTKLLSIDKYKRGNYFIYGDNIKKEERRGFLCRVVDAEQRKNKLFSLKEKRLDKALFNNSNMVFQRCFNI